MKFFKNKIYSVGIIFLISSNVYSSEIKNHASVGLSLRSGVVDSSLFTLNLKNESYSTKADWINSLYLEDGKTAQIRTEGLIKLNSEYRLRFKNKNYFGSIFSQGTHDVIRGIHYRFQLGPNIGYYFLNSDKIKLDLSSGLNATHERLEKKDSYAALRISTRMNYKINSRSDTYANLEINSDLSDFKNNFNGLFIFGFKSNLYDSFSIYSEIRNDYDNLPSKVNTDNNEFLITMGFAYDF
tara:strand:- start:814 stop:1533 length:720 start_codon:yes stop_codon:yes gene_type:complete